MSTPIFIIAEAGVNHNGNHDMAFKLIDAAVDAQADAIKFQTFKAEKLVTKTANKARYQRLTTAKNETQLDMLKRLELPQSMHFKLRDYCQKKQIRFMSTAFDQDSLHFLTVNLGMEKLKIPSGEITNGPLLLAYAKTGRELILSTGMSTLAEIEDALKVIAYGLLDEKDLIEPPSMTAFHSAYQSEAGKRLLKQKVTLLHCTTEYPAPIEDINLKAMLTMKNAFGLRVGYSDHSEGIMVPVVATAMGACLIEKHFTLNKTLQGPDHKASLAPLELKAMVKSIRMVEQMMGDGSKIPRSSEIDNRDIARKSLVAARNLTAGEIISPDMIICKRPGTGISPMSYWDMLGELVKADTDADELIK